MSAIPFLSVGCSGLPSDAGYTTSGRWRRRAPPRTSVSVRLADAQGACSLPDDVDTHAARCAFDLAGGGLDVVCVEVAHLDGRDLADLVLGDPPDRLALRRRGALLDAGRLTQEVGRRRRLEDERERAILEDRDLGRDHLAGLVGRPLVVRLGELDDVDAVRAQGRTNGRGGCRLAGRQLEGQDDADLLGHGKAGSFLEFLDLQEVELDRRLAAEDAHEDLDLVPLRVDLVDRADELGERPIGDPDALALREGDTELRCLDTHVQQDLLDVVLVERDRLTPIAWDVRPTDEARHALRVPDDEPAVRIEDHLDEDVARVDLLLDGVALALADLDLILHRDEDLEDLVLHAHRLDAVLEVGLDLVLVARVRMDDVPALVGCLGRLGRRGFHHHPALLASSETSWAKTASRTVM